MTSTCFILIHPLSISRCTVDHLTVSLRNAPSPIIIQQTESTRSSAHVPNFMFCSCLPKCCPQPHPETTTKWTMTWVLQFIARKWKCVCRAIYISRYTAHVLLLALSLYANYDRELFPQKNPEMEQVRNNQTLCLYWTSKLETEQHTHWVNTSLCCQNHLPVWPSVLPPYTQMQSDA